MSKGNVDNPDVAASTLEMGDGSAPAGTAWMVNSTAPGQHGTSLALRAELSLQVIQTETYHRKIVNLVA